MAVEFKVEHTRTSEYLIAPRDLTIRPQLNGRFDAPEIEDLLQSLIDIGQTTPILIGNNGGHPYVIAGHRRWRAAVEGITTGRLPKTFKLRCVYFRGTEVEEFQACVSENLDRAETSPLDDAHNIARFERFGMSPEEIAVFYHRKLEDGSPDTPWVRSRLALISLSADSVAALKAGRVKPNAVAILAKLSKEQQSQALRSPQVTPAICRAISRPTSPTSPVRPRQMNRLVWVKDTLSKVVQDESVPSACTAAMSREEAVIEFAKWLLENLELAEKRADAKKSLHP